MSKHQKALQRLFRKPTDFKWTELCSVLEYLGFEKIEGDGSRVKFIHHQKNILITIHKPHPGNTLKQYAVKYVIKELEKMEISV